MVFEYNIIIHKLKMNTTMIMNIWLGTICFHLHFRHSIHRCCDIYVDNWRLCIVYTIMDKQIHTIKVYTMETIIYR